MDLFFESLNGWWDRCSSLVPEILCSILRASGQLSKGRRYGVCRLPVLAAVSRDWGRYFLPDPPGERRLRSDTLPQKAHLRLSIPLGLIASYFGLIGSLHPPNDTGPESSIQPPPSQIGPKLAPDNCL